MYIRCAFFRGHARPGREAEFTGYIRERLVPLWTRFPGAEEVRVLRQDESDVADPHYEMVLQVRYASKEAIETALASDVRFESREVSKGLQEFFEGDVFHTVFRTDDYALPTD